MDILLMVMNHGLRPVFRISSGSWEHYGENDNDIVEIINLLLSPLSNPVEIIFLSADIYELEKRIGKKITKSDNIISDSELIERWGINDLELWDMEENQKLHFVDPLGNPMSIDASLRGYFLMFDEANLVQLYYNQSEIEKIEQGSGIKPQKILKRAKRQRLSNIHKEKCREIAKKLWDKDPILTVQDLIWNDEINACFNGRNYTGKTIRNWIKDLNPHRFPGRRKKK